MSTLGIPELLVIAGMVILPCLGLLLVGGIAAVVIVLVRKNKNKTR